MNTALERVDPETRSAHRQLREHRAQQVEAIVARFDGIEPPAYPDPAQRERLVDLIERTSAHNTPGAVMQVQTLSRELDSWTRAHDTASTFDQQPGAVDYRTHWQQQVEQERAPKNTHSHDQGMGW